jgi:hypothetical protein
MEALWKHFGIIDCLSVNNLPADLARELGIAERFGIEEALPLLLTAVKNGTISVDDIKKRLFENIRTIFGLPEIDQTYLEVELDRPFAMAEGGHWSGLINRRIFGRVCRTVFHGQSVLVDGRIVPAGTKGENIGYKSMETPPLKLDGGVAERGGVEAAKSDYASEHLRGREASSERPLDTLMTPLVAPEASQQYVVYLSLFSSS